MEERQFELDQLIQQFSEEAVNFAQNGFEVSLDYSIESIDLVEGILTIIYDMIPKNRFQRLFKKTYSEKEIDYVTNIMGAYLGETFRKHQGGEWSIDSESFPGYSLIRFLSGSLGFFPMEKVRKRLDNGPEDSVNGYFLVLLNRAKEIQ